MSSFTGAKALDTQTKSEYNKDGSAKALLYLILVCHHVSQSLIVNHSKKYVNFKLTAVRATVHSFCAVVIVPGWKIKTWVNVKNIRVWISFVKEQTCSPNILQVFPMFDQP